MLSVAGYLVAARLTFRIGFPLDDAWIHQTYARNLAILHEWSFIPGLPSAGSTSPLWTFILSGGYLLGLGPHLWTFLCGWLLLWALGLAGMRAFQSITPDQSGWGFAAGMLLVVEWHLVWAAVSGMETLLSALLALVTLGMLISKRTNWLVLGALIGISIWARPDGLTLLGPSFFVVAVQASAFRNKLHSAMSLILGFILFFFPYLLWNRSLSGDWWPNTYYAKQAEYAVELLHPLWMRLLEQGLLPIVGVGILLVPGFIRTIRLAISSKKWSQLAMALWAIGYVVLYALRLPVNYQHGRYLMPMMPVFFILGVLGTITWINSAPSGLLTRVISRTWLLSVAMLGIVFWFLGARAYGRDVAFIESEMVTAAQWVSENTQTSALVAAHDIGALGYFGGREILDLAGLVSPEVIPFIRDETRLASWLTRQGASYLVTFPGWYPILTEDLEPVYRNTGRFSQAFEGENMAIYPWELRLR